MKNAALLLSLVLGLSVCGCAKKNTVTQPGEAPVAQGDSGSQSNSLVGTYKIDIKMPEAKKDDPAAQLGNAMGSMFLSGAKLEIQEGGRFKMTLMGMPIEGPYQVEGKKITFTPEKVMGMTPEEAKKMNPNSKADTSPMVGTISEDNKSITMSPEKKGDAEMKFTREITAPKAPAKETVTSDEKAWVGEYSGNIEMPAPKDDKEKQDQAMAKAMASSLSLVLKADNTMTMNMMFELEGSWSIKDGKISLDPSKVLGMEADKSTSSKPNSMSGSLGSDGKTITIEEPGKDGTKLVFTKK